VISSGVVLQVGQFLESSISYLIVILLVLVILSSAIKVVREYERGVIFRLGRLIGAKGPGLFLIVPIADKFIKISRIVGKDGPILLLSPSAETRPSEL